MDVLVMDLASKYPWVITVLSVIGLLRMLIKPIMSFAHAYVAGTESKEDDITLQKIEEGKVFKAVLWVLDYLTSIKIKK